jgi:hypothetical protein
VTEEATGTSDAESTDTGQADAVSTAQGEDTETSIDTSTLEGRLNALEKENKRFVRENKRLKGVLDKLEPTAESMKEQHAAAVEAWEAERAELRAERKAALAESATMQRKHQAQKREAAITDALGLADPRVRRIALEDIEATAKEDGVDINDPKELKRLASEWGEKDENTAFVNAAPVGFTPAAARPAPRRETTVSGRLAAVAADSNRSQAQRDAASKWGKAYGDK